MSLSAEAVLDLWERGASQPPGLAAVAVLSAATGEEAEELRRLPIGARDALLADLLRELRGPVLEGVAGCPSCSEKVEVAFDTALMRQAGEPAATYTLGKVEFRLPTTDDLLAVTQFASPAEMRIALLRRCIALDDPPPAILDAVEEAMGELDPSGDVTLAMTCPACGHGWTVLLDLPAFVWKEIAALAGRIASDVHLLASAYGWGEREILRMTAARRQLYIRQAYG